MQALIHFVEVHTLYNIQLILGLIHDHKIKSMQETTHMHNAL